MTNKSMCLYIAICPYKSTLCFSPLYYLCGMYKVISVMGGVPKIKTWYVREKLTAGSV